MSSFWGCTYSICSKQEATQAWHCSSQIRTGWNGQLTVGTALRHETVWLCDACKTRCASRDLSFGDTELDNIPSVQTHQSQFKMSESWKLGTLLSNKTLKLKKKKKNGLINLYQYHFLSANEATRSHLVKSWLTGNDLECLWWSSCYFWDVLIVQISNLIPHKDVVGYTTGN